MPWSCGSRWSRGSAGSPWARCSPCASASPPCCGSTALLVQATRRAPAGRRRLAAGLVDRPDASREVNLALLAVARTAVPRSVVPAARDLQRLAQRRHAVLASILLDEGVLHFDSRAK